jgi:DNA-binding CsgD family transcriptional regulator
MAIPSESFDAVNVESLSGIKLSPSCTGQVSSRGRLDSPKRGKAGLGKGDQNRAKPKLSSQQEPGHSSDLVSAGLEALDLLDIGVCVTNRLGELLFANRTARQILTSRDGLEVTADGVLGALPGCCLQSLSALLQQAVQAQGNNGSSKDTALAVCRPSGKRSLTLLVRRLGAADPTPNVTEPAALVFVLDPELPVDAAESGLRQLYGLTSSEARLAQLMMSGRTFEECYKLLQIRPSTARMHLGNLFAKTGVRRQGQLISLLLKSVGMVRTTSADQQMLAPRQSMERRELNRKDKLTNDRAPESLAAGLEALDLLDIGVGVTNGCGEVLFANQTARQILAARDGLELTAQGVLYAFKGCCNQSLSALLQQAAQAQHGSSERPNESALAVRRPSGRRSLTLLVRSLHGTGLPLSATQPGALVFLLDPELPVQATESGLRQLYGFTSSEARLACLLMEGKAIDDCCQPLKIRPSTARRHLANMFVKARVQHQSQLICLLLKSIGVVRFKADQGSSRHATSPMMMPAWNPRSTPSTLVAAKVRTLRPEKIRAAR